MKTVSVENKVIARYLWLAFDGKPVVKQYTYKNPPLQIDIVSSTDQPKPGLNSYGTIGLSDFPRKKGTVELEVRVELCGVADSTVKFFPNIMASVAFKIMRSNLPCHPGSTMKDYVKKYYADTRFPHLFFTNPFCFQSLKLLSLEHKKVAWLFCVPISDAEFNYLKREGNDKFKALIKSSGAYNFNFNRQELV
jgi:hypothetical protein